MVQTTSNYGDLAIDSPAAFEQRGAVKANCQLGRPQIQTLKGKDKFSLDNFGVPPSRITFYFKKLCGHRMTSCSKRKLSIWRRLFICSNIAEDECHRQDVIDKSVDRAGHALSPCRLFRKRKNSVFWGSSDASIA